MTPMRWNRLLLIIVATALSGAVLFLFGSVALERQTDPEADAAVPNAAKTAGTVTQPLVTFVDPVKGGAKAKNVAVVYADYACPFCRELSADLDRLMTAHPDSFKLVWKSLSSLHDPAAEIAAEAALCAKDQGRFWEYHERLFSTSIGSEVELAMTAKDLGLNEDSFSRCLGNHENKPLVERTIAEAVALGIDGTPYLFINGERYSGRLSYERLEELLGK